ncbi:E3 SUMO-protein ligase ZNF451 [Alligator mississippiensis]|uniref:E3 SUMO-protein ligase ZNF451 n=1 Tax=Alligator mississippiensis TaxID=8496 RepID=UPI0007114847|nr:E3 SUMO-protein ligase ZNF451 [Alligator mississippiensis]
MEAVGPARAPKREAPAESEEDVQFVSEGPLRPVLECIDLVSSEDEEPSSSASIHRKVKHKDHIDYQKERVASTLARLARHVEVEIQQKEEKNKAFKEKMDSQYAHGLQELEFIRGHSDTEAAKLCVDQWLKMPGLKPGMVNYGRGGFQRAGGFQRTGQAPVKSSPILCPVMHCNRKFDNGHLLLGHLKRFDHSPCDPTITLHGAPASAVACVICFKRFVTSQEYCEHLVSKINENDGHKRDLPPQLIQCFACPHCFLLFSKRDECLKHMSEKNHFLQVFKLSDEAVTALPLPFPTYAKKLLVSLCKEVPFQVKCTSCRQTLRSHMELTAHFRTRCRNSGPVVLSEKSISQVAEIFVARGRCQNCDKLFADENQIKQHNQTTQHKVKIITTIEESILIFCHINGRKKNLSRISQTINRSKSSLLKRPLTLSESANENKSAISKQKNNLENKNQEVGVKLGQDDTCKIKAWFCECFLKFSSEESVEKHIFSANRICYKCAVCGKLAENSSIISLHMSRFHGGAHLTNFLFWCRACNADLSKEENVMAHVTEFHGGHGYYFEQEEALEDESMLSSDTVCSTSVKCEETVTISMEQSLGKNPILGKWQCRICEEMFDSEGSVKKHCMSLESHEFHRYCCGLCKNHFRKIETLYRHCQTHHNQQVQVKYYCGICGNLFFDVEEEFLTHYKSSHSMDYMFVSDQTEASIKIEEDFLPLEEENYLSCGCREDYISKASRKIDYDICLKNMLKKGNLWFRCCFCTATAQNYADLNDHLSSHPTQKCNQEMYVVKCSACSKNFTDLKSAHQHYHDKHCFLQKPDTTQFSSKKDSNVFKFTASGACVSKKPDKLKLSEKFPKRSISPSLKGPIDGKKGRSKKTHSPEPNEVEDSELPDFDYLKTMTHIVLVDLDNWGSFFTRLPASLNQGTFIWGFQGGCSNWKPPDKCKIFDYLNKIGCFFLHPRCGTRREAADFALCMQAGRLDEHLPKQIPFTVLSGDQSFLELEKQFKLTHRSAHILNPHHIDGDMMCALLNSISDTTKDSEDEDIKKTVQMSLEETKKHEEQDAELQEAIKRSLEDI